MRRSRLHVQVVPGPPTDIADFQLPIANRKSHDVANFGRGAETIDVDGLEDWQSTIGNRKRLNAVRHSGALSR